ncbi:hypothetical protein LJR045_002893 [Microbacterium sp. LjRoot45]|uniref:hypothetical protein n=1 Tax=Microbacterium sp. LjRoot45 TaxID=3342329 RepID=UPI001199EE8E
MTDIVWIVWAEDSPVNTPVLGAFASEADADAYAAKIDSEHESGALVTPLSLPFTVS